MSGNGRCLQRFSHEDGTCSSSLAVRPASSSSYYLAVGAESGVVSVYNESFKGYDSGSTVAGAVKPLRSIMNLRTVISSISIHPGGEVMAIASEQQKDKLKLGNLLSLHLHAFYYYAPMPLPHSPPSFVHCLQQLAHREDSLQSSKMHRFQLSQRLHGGRQQ